ncbi:mandelate racemase/muconate lactonizing enzyme family protein [Tuwongella immobilis]|uniref:Mandelate racemase/muconate lactonizing enzyme C-terminal domain-containing protein n=1 Tax=Tuwongella immobilis TaxID=692036 RepID=A0A6C2YJ65_9BACT|nr:mandelate racemase/muconate lactonizing enzyme family protein [Tuwongella immobilis]VIP01446.1 mandelate racemase : Enolase superfamily enzyme related to L-alanine-DL-glutamate epimerase OS=Singulisphaera acidiphila (strain ATCC BAA-1392 / DSM 18658 / VKM B-2454 / MOB10) GN=Sinac_0917 PE=4 SV=1: MR_MLE_N: MR_MLE_C [Tuwongella immobilis]VTR98430.1 mandelate racemase : Enolase superfamily enzyme related to L-alanine-DL-glutamate epimerase OS=Singulisphaera acidiphila (strain ATCC BAA-1392 / DSM 
MKIVAIHTTSLAGATEDNGWPDKTDPNAAMNTIIELETDSGMIGIGSCFSTPALVEAALTVLRPMLLGETAFEPERVSEKLRQTTFWFGRGGAIEHAISGIDIALWDLMGKAVGQPVSRLLGGNYRDRIKPYASILFDEPAILREKLQEQLSRGFKAIKMGWRPFGRVSRKLDEQLIQTARDTVGPDVDLMVDAGGSEQFWPHTARWAIETAKMLGEYGIVWFEEALKPDDLEGYIALSAQSPVLVASGEVFTRRQSFQPFITGRALDVIQPDLTKCGGISEGRRLGWMAYDHGVLMVPHGWNTGIGVAADLALMAAMPVASYVEYQTGVPYIESLTLPQFTIDANGMLEVPTGPGLGITLNPETMARFGTRKTA